MVFSSSYKRLDETRMNEVHIMTLALVIVITVYSRAALTESVMRAMHTDNITLLYKLYLTKSYIASCVFLTI